MSEPAQSVAPTIVELTKRLSEPFSPSEVKWKPQVISGNRAMALAYVDARVIQDRLDDVLGVSGWQDDYQALPDGSVVCSLRLLLGDQWITKTDVGGPSEQPDGGDRMKAAFSDALKRAAVKFGIGRYLYRLPNQWCDWDAQKRHFVTPPKLPAYALPSGGGKAASPKTPTKALPATGPELLKRLQDFEAQLVKKGLCVPGALLTYVREAGDGKGRPKDIAAWDTPAIALAVESVKKFDRECGLQKPDDSKHDAKATIDERLMQYLFALSARKGFTGKQLQEALKKNFNKKAAHGLTVAEYRVAIEKLDKAAPARGKASA